MLKALFRNNGSGAKKSEYSVDKAFNADKFRLIYELAPNLRLTRIRKKKAGSLSA